MGGTEGRQPAPRVRSHLEPGRDRAGTHEHLVRSTLDATSGLAETTGYADSGPYKQGLALADAVGGVHGAIAIMTGLFERERTGTAVHIDVSQLETLLNLGGDMALWSSVVGHSPARRGARAPEGSGIVQGVYRCAGDDEWVTLTAAGDDAFSTLAAVIPGVGGSDHDEIDRTIGAWTATRNKFEVAALLQSVGIPAAAVATNEDLVNDAQLAARKYFVELPVAESVPRLFSGVPLQFSNALARAFAAPRLGEHNAEILGELGYDAAAIAKLMADGALHDRPL